MTVTSYHYYAFDAAQLLETCIDHLQDVVELDTKGSHAILYELKEALLLTERMLQDYFVQVIRDDTFEAPNTESSKVQQSGLEHQNLPSLSECMSALRKSMEQKRDDDKAQTANNRTSSPRHQHFSKSPARHIQTSTTSGAPLHDYSSARNVIDTLLFRLIVALQLCLVRISDAHFAIAGCRRQHSGPNAERTHRKRRQRKRMVNVSYCGGILGVTAFLLRKHNNIGGDRIDTKEAIQTFAKVGVAAFLGRMALRRWKTLWMTSKLDKTAIEIAEWQQQWLLVHDGDTAKEDSTTSLAHQQSPETHGGDASKAKLLMDYARQRNPNNKNKSYFITDGELRFLIVRKAMDAYYALTGAEDDANENEPLPTYFRDLIQKSWSLVSKPALKTFSLRASRLLKGASVADRIEIAGVPCFIISKHPCPELAAAIQRFRRKDRRRLSLQLSTIDEFEETTPSSMDATIPKKLFAGSNDSFRQQDIILHCTGGGWFAHMIAFDLLYLLDWSASTGAVVIIPEYVLLPEQPFPGALQQMTNVYTTLVSGDALCTLGIEVNNIVVTGESTGGNLAAALCVNLCLDADSRTAVEQQTKDGGTKPASPPKVASDFDDEYLFPESVGSTTSGSGSDDQGESTRSSGIRLPDALMLSCAVLNLSLELSHSRVLGTEDPVLPSGVISAISDAYLPPSLGISKKHLLASPFYAPDSILCRFPPTLLFASSSDPMLDDSVVFNQRLRSLGVASELRACQNLCHAGLWGLGTYGFPEAMQVQRECQEWLSHRMAHKADLSP